MSYTPHPSFSTDRTESRGAFPSEETFAAVAVARRRLVLAVLDSQSDPLSDETLAAHVAGREAGTDPEDVSDEARDSVATSLYHRHLPKLAALGVVDRTEAGTTLADDAPSFAAMGLLDVADSSDDSGVEEADALFDVLSSDERRVVVATLAEEAFANSISLDDLSAALVADDAPGPDAEFASDETRRSIELHHRHLPKLVDCGLVSWDREAGRVRFEGHPLLRESWVATASRPVDGPKPGDV
jgi:DNA-binding transcriptional ArsR family regulator